MDCMAEKQEDRHKGRIEWNLRKQEGDADIELMNEEFIRMLQVNLDALKVEMATFDQNRKFVDKATLEKLRVIGALLSDASDTRIKLARAAKLLAQTLTPEQRLDEVVKLVRAMPGEARRLFINRLLTAHKQAAEKNVQHQNKKQIETAVERMRKAIQPEHLAPLEDSGDLVGGEDDLDT